MSILEHLGWTPFFQCQLDLLDDPELQPLRVAVEHRSQYQLIGAAGAVVVDGGASSASIEKPY